MKSLKANGFAEKTKRILKNKNERDDWQNEDDSGQNVKPKIEEWTGPESVEDAENNTETDSAAPKSAEKTLEASWWVGRSAAFPVCSHLMLLMYPWQWIFRSLSNMLIHVCSVPRNWSPMLAPRRSPSLFLYFSTQDVHPKHESGLTIGSPQPLSHFVLEPSISKMIPESAPPTRITLVATAATIKASSEHAGGPGSKTLKKRCGAEPRFFQRFANSFWGFCVAGLH